jgi:hypothetical protein
MKTKVAVSAVITVVAMVCARDVAAAEPPACSLLTQAKVAEVLGVPVGAGAPIMPSQPAQCAWAPQGDRTKRALLDILTPLGSRTPVDRFNTGKTPVNGITKTPVTGIGDEAYYTSTPGLGTALSVRKGTSAFLIRVSGFPEDAAKAFEKTLALNVLTKL